MQRSVQFETVIKDRELLAQQVEEELDKIPDVFRLITHILQAFKEQTVNTKWIKAEVDRITALIYFIVVISVFIVATLLYPVFLQKFAQVFQDNELTKLVILIASSAALAAVIYMSHRRMSEL